MGRFEIFKDTAKEYRFRLIARNGEIILASEGYKAKAKCKKGVESVKTHSKDVNNFIANLSVTNEYYFILKSRNGETIGISETYTSADALKNGIESVKANAPDSEIIDLTIK